MNQYVRHDPSVHAHPRILAVASILCVLAGRCYEARAEPKKTGSNKPPGRTMPDIFPSLAELPHPKRLWFVPDVFNAALDGSAVTPNGLFVVQDQRSNEIAALDVKTGRAKWRARPGAEPFELAVVGEHVLAFSLYGNTLSSYAVDTGALEWSNPHACSGNYQVGQLSLRGSGNVAVGSCALRPWGPQPPLGEMVFQEPTAHLQGLDLTTGKELWRVATFGREPAVTCDGEMLAVAPFPKLAGRKMVGTVSYLDARTGAEKWRTRVEYDSGILGLAPGIVLVVGTKLQAIDAKSGHKKWALKLFDDPMQTGSLPGDILDGRSFSADILDDLLLWPRDGIVVGYVAATGREMRRWHLPESSGVASNRVRALQVVDGRIVVVMDDWSRHGTIAIFDEARRRILAAPEISRPVILPQGVLICESGSGLAGFSLQETEADVAERNLEPSARVNALLQRMDRTSAGKHMRPTEMTELEMIPGYVDILVSIARDRSSGRRAEAAAVIGQRKIAAGIPVLKAILGETIPPDPGLPATAPEEPKSKPQSSDEFPAYRRQWEAARRYRAPADYWVKLDAHRDAVELRKDALEALAGFERR